MSSRTRLGAAPFGVRHDMKVLSALVPPPPVAGQCAGGDPATTNDTEAAQWQRICKRLEELGATNAERFLKSPFGQQLIVHPSFGIAWDEVPPLTLTNPPAVAAVRA